MYLLARVLSVIVLFSISGHGVSQETNLTVSRFERMGFTYGDTYAAQNISTVNSSEIFFHEPMGGIASYLPDYIRPMYEMNFGMLVSSADAGYLMGIGPRVEWQVGQKFSIAGAFRFVYLDKYIYRSADGSHKRNYGGHRQFQYYWEAIYQINKSFSFGYRWLHMSNGRQVLPESLKYEHNPVIETHNLVLQFPF